jgi:hypothetical protein
VSIPVRKGLRACEYLFPREKERQFLVAGEAFLGRPFMFSSRIKKHKKKQLEKGSYFR